MLLDIGSPKTPLEFLLATLAVVDSVILKKCLGMILKISSITLEVSEDQEIWEDPVGWAAMEDQDKEVWDQEVWDQEVWVGLEVWDPEVWEVMEEINRSEGQLVQAETLLEIWVQTI